MTLDLRDNRILPLLIVEFSARKAIGTEYGVREVISDPSVRRMVPPCIA